jgi:hypothetical protein
MWKFNRKGREEHKEKFSPDKASSSSSFSSSSSKLIKYEDENEDEEENERRAAFLSCVLGNFRRRMMLLGPGRQSPARPRFKSHSRTTAAAINSPANSTVKNRICRW